MKKEESGRCVHCREKTRSPKVAECPSCAVVSAMRRAGIYFPYLGTATPHKAGRR